MSSPGALASVQNKLDQEIGHDLVIHQGTSFDGMIRVWEKKHGTGAVAPLLQIAFDRSRKDSDRYIAVMGATKLGGSAIAPDLVPLLQDHSWMVRSAALRALAVLKNPKTAAAVVPLIRDPALVVRVEAVHAIEMLQPAGAVEALIEALQSRSNYHAGKAQWVPSKALSALVRLKASSAAPRLKPLLRHKSDPELLRQTVDALTQLTGKKLKPGASLQAQVEAWRSARLN